MTVPFDQQLSFSLHPSSLFPPTIPHTLMRPSILRNVARTPLRLSRSALPASRTASFKAAAAAKPGFNNLRHFSSSSLRRDEGATISLLKFKAFFLMNGAGCG
jgi:hypothetical protein